MRQLLVCLLVFVRQTSSLSQPSKSIRALPTRLFAAADDAASNVASPSAVAKATPTPTKPISVLVCPAQFCVPADYEQLLTSLQTKMPNTIRSAATVPLPRTEWIQVAKQLPTAAYIQGTLPVEETLRWYFDAMEKALLDLMNESSSSSNDIAIIGHSIGGWIARAYLGGLSQSSSAVYRAARHRVRSLVTLGTPHQPAVGADQTRGLIRAVASATSCTPAALAAEAGIQVTCVGSRAVTGGWEGPENLLALGSYGSFVGDFFGGPPKVGDGIVPLESSLLEAPAVRVVLDTPRHLHVLPTPWNLWDGYQPSVPLDVPHYLSDDVVDQWIDYL